MQKLSIFNQFFNEKYNPPLLLDYYYICFQLKINYSGI